jgi:hypothetical protein
LAEAAQRFNRASAASVPKVRHSKLGTCAPGMMAWDDPITCHTCSRRAEKDEAGSVLRVPAPELESIVIKALQQADVTAREGAIKDELADRLLADACGSPKLPLRFRREAQIELFRADGARHSMERYTRTLS